MPAFTRSSMMHQQLPPTPPHVHDFPFENSHQVSQQPVSLFEYSDVQSSIYEPRKVNSIGNLVHANALVPHATFSQDSYPQVHPYHKTPLPGKAMNAPILPSINKIVNGQHLQPSARANLASQPKEEKMTGGVAAHLDYEMDVMVDFVSETAHGLYESYVSTIYLADIDVSRSIVNSKSPMSADFRKFVAQVLTSTRLPCATIVLGLCYLANRMTMLSSDGVFDYGNGCVRPMLTVALLLGSKFLDDNTFQNKSWSEVSSIPVSDINDLESEWLEAIEWGMHLDIRDPGGLSLWFQRWNQYSSTKIQRVEQLMHCLARTHLDGPSVRRQQTPHHRTSPNNYRTTHYDGTTNARIGDNMQACWATPRYHTWSSVGSQLDYSPPSAPETGPNTPQWYGTDDRTACNTMAQQSCTTMKPPPGLCAAGYNGTQAVYQNPYAQPNYSYGQEHTYLHEYCRSQYNHFPPGLGYGPQFVMG